MQMIFGLIDRIDGIIERAAGNWLLPTLARFSFAAVLLIYYWNSALTKLGVGVTGFLFPNDNTYYQMFPKLIEAANFDFSVLGPVHYVIALAGMWAEFILPLLIVVGLFSRLAALGMIGFVLVQSFVDVAGHRAKLGGWFNGGVPNEIMDERLMWIAVLAVVLVKGGGPFSLDAVLRQQR